LSEFHQIYNFSAVADKDELIWFWARKVKDQSHSDTNYGQERHFENFEGHGIRAHSFSGKGILVDGLLSRII